MYDIHRQFLLRHHLGAVEFLQQFLGHFLQLFGDVPGQNCQAFVVDVADDDLGLLAILYAQDDSSLLSNDNCSP
ncbi:hypothetical protein D9M72_639610 [compost metagenome]